MNDKYYPRISNHMLWLFHQRRQRAVLNLSADLLKLVVCLLARDEPAFSPFPLNLDWSKVLAGGKN